MPKYLRVIFIVAFAVLMLSGTANALSVNWIDVRLTKDGVTQSYRTTASSVDAFLAEQHITLGRLDTVSPDAATMLTKDNTNEITILEGFDVTVNIDGKRQKTGVVAGTKASELTKKLESQDGATYMIAGEKNKVLTAGSEIKLNKVFNEEQITVVPLIYDTEIVLDDTIDLGEEHTVTPGEAGEMQIVSRLTKVDGKIVKTQIMSEKIMKQPVTEVVRRGTKQPLPKVETEVGARAYTKVLDMSATAYSAHFECTGKNPGHPAYGITASGMKVDHGIVAVDPRVIPLGTRLFVEGYGEAIAADTGSAIIGQKIDLYHESLEDAKRYGRRMIKVYILA